MKSDNYQILNIHNSALNECLAEIRDKAIQTSRPRFRENLRQSGIYCGYELSKCMAYESQQVQTVLGNAQVNLLNEQPVLIPILRAALPFYEGLQSSLMQKVVLLVPCVRRLVPLPLTLP